LAVDDDKLFQLRLAMCLLQHNDRTEEMLDHRALRLRSCRALSSRMAARTLSDFGFGKHQNPPPMLVAAKALNSNTPPSRSVLAVI
jgi:hypothetical protein